MTAKAQPSVSEVVSVLRSQRENVYAVIDAARDDDALTVLYSHDDRFQSLYAGNSEATLGRSGPLLVQPSEALLDQLVRQGWGQAWGIYLTSPADFDAVRKHFRTLLMVRRQKDGSELYFRFYDPRVLKLFLPTCSAEQTQLMFGPITSYLLETDGGASMARCIPGPDGVAIEEITWAEGTP